MGGRYRYKMAPVIFKSPLPDVTIPEEPLTPFVFARAKELGAKAAFIDGTTDQPVSYAELDDRVRRLAGGLLERGLAKGEVVAIMAANCPDYAVVFHGVAMAGGIVTTINPTYTEREVHHQLNDAAATKLVTIVAPRYSPRFINTCMP